MEQGMDGSSTRPGSRTKSEMNDPNSEVARGGADAIRGTFGISQQGTAPPPDLEVRVRSLSFLVACRCLTAVVRETCRAFSIRADPRRDPEGLFVHRHDSASVLRPPDCGSSSKPFGKLRARLQPR